MLRGKFLYNAFAIPRSLNDLEPIESVTCEKEHYKQADGSIGAGLYHIASYLSHSCEPNCEVKFDGNKLSLVACRDLKEGEEVVVSFAPAGLGAKKRRNLIKEKYRFVCKCSGCSSA
jgi:import receptor subunit TOM20